MAGERIIIAEFEGPAELIEAARKTRDAGYRRFDCHSPFLIHGMDEAMGIRRSRLGFIVAVFAFIGLSSAILLQWWASSIAYPLVISGKPFFSYQAYLPVTFALAVLLSAISAIIGMLVLNKLPRLNHPLFKSGIFAKIGDDGFFISVDSDDPKFDIEETARFLKSIGAGAIEVIEG